MAQIAKTSKIDFSHPSLIISILSIPCVNQERKSYNYNNNNNKTGDKRCSTVIKATAALQMEKGRRKERRKGWGKKERQEERERKMNSCIRNGNISSNKIKQQQ